MFIVLKRDWVVLDSSVLGGTAIIPAGQHEVERVRHPLGLNGLWLVVRGTSVGAAEDFWRDQKTVTIIDDPLPQEDPLNPQGMGEKTNVAVG